MTDPRRTQARRELLLALRDPARTRALEPQAWSALVSTARDANLLGALTSRLREAGLRACPQAQLHLDGMYAMGQRQHLSIQWEAHQLQAALGVLEVPVLLLKGSAYVMGFPEIGAGRLFGDIDILVPKAALADVESRLMLNGWVSDKTDPYDQRYYREWMHELPPLVHLRRQTALDVHHAIAPETARLRPSSEALLQAAVPLPEQPGLATLAPSDMVLHSMLHLNVNDQLGHALRDLSDLDLLLRHFGRDAAFWPQLVARARAFGLARVLRDGLRSARRVFDTPVPADVEAGVADAAPGALRQRLMDALWERALRPRHASLVGPADRLALWLLYVRAHWMRMPTGLLLRHLAVKAMQRGEPETAAQAQR